MRAIYTHSQERDVNSIRIAVVCPNYGLVGGAEMFAFELTERLAQMDDFSIHVFANRWRSGKGITTFHKIPILDFPRWLRPISFALFARRAINARGFDIVHSHERLYAFDLLTHHGLPHATWIKKVRKKRPSLFDRAVSHLEQKGILNSGLPLIMPVSNLGKVELQKAFNLPDSRIQVIHPGITVKRYLEPDQCKCRREIRERHSLLPDDVVALFVGMNFDLKGLDRIMQSISRFTGRGEKHPALKLLVVGNGDFKKYQKFAGDLGIEKRVVFAGERQAVEKYFLASDFFALMSHMDSFGIVVLEAMASGLPVIISDTVGARDIVEPGKTGFIIAAESYDQSMRVALEAMLQPDLRGEMGTAARRVAIRYDWDQIAAQVADLYRLRLMHRRPADHSYYTDGRQ